MIKIALQESDSSHANELASKKHQALVEVANEMCCVNQEHQDSIISVKATLNNPSRYELRLEEVCCKHLELNIQMKLLNEKRFKLTFGEPLTATDDSTLTALITLAKLIDNALVELNGPDNLTILIQGDAMLTYRAICSAENAVSNIFRDKLETKVNSRISEAFNT